MRVITEIKYESNDGFTFSTAEECKEHEECISYEDKLGKLSYLVNTKLSYSMVSTFIYNNYDEIKEIMEDVTEVHAEVDWSEVPEGTVILVKDYPHEDWIVERKFLFRDAHGRFACIHSCGRPKVVAYWSMAKLKD